MLFFSGMYRLSVALFGLLVGWSLFACGSRAVSTGSKPDEATARKVERAPRCPAVSSPVRGGVVEDQRLDEVSGLVFSRRDPGVIFVHNDSGDAARVYALETTGRLVARLELLGVEAQDIEDIACDERFLYLGDIGDNKEARESVSVYRFVQPKLALGDSPELLKLYPQETLTLVYPDRAHDAETLLVDPKDGSVLIVTKDRRGPSSVMSTGPRPWSRKGPVRLEEVARLELGWSWLGPSRLATGGDISSDGAWIAVRTYTHLHLFRRESEGSLPLSLSLGGCATVLQLEPQGEAVAFGTSGRFVWTISEGRHQPIWRYAMHEDGCPRSRKNIR